MANHSNKTRANPTRRRFIKAGVSAVSLSALNPRLSNMSAWGEGEEMVLPDIDPALIGPFYYGDEEEGAVVSVVDSGSPFRYWGPGKPEHVNRFEEQFAHYMGARFAVGVTSGTAALDCAITGLGVGPGDEVIVPAYTWWSDYTCVVHAGALPVFADIDETFNLDPERFKSKITPRTKAVIAVHLLGGPCDMDPIMEIAKQNGIAVLEDCAQCVGGSYKGKKLGTIGDVGIYSFQINKMITSGEGGAVVTNEPTIYERAVRFHDMGGTRSVFNKRLGGAKEKTFAGENFRMNEFTGAVLGAQLSKLDRMIIDMRLHANAIRDGIADIDGLVMRSMPDPDGDIGYAVYFDAGDKEGRDRCIRQLRKQNVPASALSGSVLLPIQESVINKRTRHPAWPSFNSPEGKAIQYGRECCVQTLNVYDRFVQIRIGPNYTMKEDEYIAKAVRELFPI